MKILFSNDQTIDLEINDSPLGNVYRKIYKHLSCIPIPWREWDNPLYEKNFTYPQMVDRLIKYATIVSVDIDRARCLNRDQEYFNYIHKIYEKNYNGQPAWLDFHEHIHICENYFQEFERFFCIDYREKSGPLEKPMDSEWLTNTQTTVPAGTLYVMWAELGKTPYSYWMDNEPNDITRICELVKPWLKLRPKIYIALRDTDLMQNIQRENFESWWDNYHDQWIEHWNLPRWTVEDIFGASVIGKTNQVELLSQQLKNNVAPTRVLLQ